MPGSDKGIVEPSEQVNYIPVKRAAKISGLTTRHIRNLLSKGKIWGVKMGRDWFTTEQAVREYLARDRRTGPKPTSKT